MGKELYPRFRCVMCGWLAHYSMLEKAPYKIEVRGMKVEGFGGISYHHVWGAKKMYKEFLRSKVRELCKELGLKLVDEANEDEEEERAASEPDDEETTVDDDSEALGLGAGVSSSVVRKTPSRSVVRVAHEVASGAGIEDIEVVTEEVTRERFIQTMQAISTSRLVSSSPFRLQEQSSIRTIEQGQPSIRAVAIDSEFVEGGENNG